MTAAIAQSGQPRPVNSSCCAGDNVVNATSILKIYVLLAVVYGLAVVGIWIVIDRSAAEKIAVTLAMPVGVLWFLFTGLLVVSRQRSDRSTFRLMLICWLAFTICGNGLFATWAVETLEGDFRQVNPLAAGPFSAVVVLGGGATQAANLRHQGNWSGDRLILAAQLYHQGRTERIICTGRRIESMDSTGFDPADQSADILLKLGVPGSAIEKLGGRNTSEEMQTLGQRYSKSENDSQPSTNIGLITSAWHLPRALALAERNGFEATPLPADFLTGPERPLTTAELINSVIPQGDSYLVLARVMKEYIGRAVRR